MITNPMRTFNRTMNHQQCIHKVETGRGTLKGTYLQTGWLQCQPPSCFVSLEEENRCLMIRFRVVKLAVLSMAVCMKCLNFIIQLTTEWNNTEFVSRLLFYEDSQLLITYAD